MEDTEDPEEKQKIKEIYEKFNKEYDQLIKEIKNAYKSEKKITTEELYSIRLEL
jgi:replication initiation and membrane attachment protein DnaB